jgi:hypothetical protein
MQQQSQQLLARAAFAADQHCGRCRRDSLDVVQELFGSWVFRDPGSEHGIAHAATDVERRRWTGDYALRVRDRAPLLAGAFDGELPGRLAVAFLLLVLANSDGWNRFADFQSRSRL